MVPIFAKMVLIHVGLPILTFSYNIQQTEFVVNPAHWMRFTIKIQKKANIREMRPQRMVDIDR